MFLKQGNLSLKKIAKRVARSSRPMTFHEISRNIWLKVVKTLLCF